MHLPCLVFTLVSAEPAHLANFFVAFIAITFTIHPRTLHVFAPQRLELHPNAWVLLFNNLYRTHITLHKEPKVSAKSFDNCDETFGSFISAVLRVQAKRRENAALRLLAKACERAMYCRR
jgi:hypothetical protein